MGDDLAKDQQQGGHRSAQLYPPRAALPGSERLQAPLRRRIAANAILVAEQKQVERREETGNPQDGEAHRVAVKSVCRSDAPAASSDVMPSSTRTPLNATAATQSDSTAAIASEAQPIQTPRNLPTPSLSGLKLYPTLSSVSIQQHRVLATNMTAINVTLSLGRHVFNTAPRSQER